MKNIHNVILLSILIFFSQCILFARDKSDETFEELVQGLKSPDVETRRATVVCLSVIGTRKAIEPLIEVLDDPDEIVRTKAWETLKKLARVNYELDKIKWNQWWEEEGSKKYSAEARESKESEILETRITVALIVVGISIIVLVLFILVFAFIGGYKIKELKEKIRQAEAFISGAEKLIGESSKAFDELSKRRDEMSNFASKLREENEGELERFMELLESNTQHKIRESIAQLREEAEKEIDHSFNQMKEDVQAEMKDLIKEQREKVILEMKKFGEDFLREIEAHKLYIEGSFYLMNNRFQDALKTFKKLATYKPDYYLAWNNMGNVYRQLKRYDEALESYQKALEFSHDNPVVLYNISSAYALLKRKDKMLEYLSKVIQKDGELKDDALNDPCFQEYWNDFDFKDLTES